MKQPVVIGTAGHVDHGKTSLVYALTGTDTDRLAEEKRRGITIENGFASLTLPDGRTAGIIDVPGHEKFVRRMLAGSGGVDIALLTVACDDGVMPQTREHLDILKLLGVPAGVAALTKADLAPDEDWLALIREEVLALTKGVFVRDPAAVAVSAFTGRGLEELVTELQKAADLVPPRPKSRLFRLPADRIFTRPGFGTVVTGTLLGGSAITGEAAVIYPQKLETRIRQIQVHSQTVEEARPGQRAALNLVNVRKEDLARGDILALPGSLEPSLLLDARLSILPSSPAALKNGQVIYLHLLARQIRSKVILMNQSQLSAGQSDYVQFRLSAPAAARRGDRLVIRQLSPARTIGGGEILDPCPQKHRRGRPEILEQFQTKEQGTVRQRVELAVKERPASFDPLPEIIRRSDLGPEARAQANILAGQGRITALAGDIYIHASELANLTEKLKILLKQHHKNQPFSPGMPLEEIRSRLAPAAPAPAWDGLFSYWLSQDLAVREEGFLRLAAFEPRVDAEKNQYCEMLLKSYEGFGLSLPADSAVLPPQTPDQARRRRAAYSDLVQKGLLISLGSLFHIHKDSYEKAFAVFAELARSGPAEPGPYRDALGTSRKIAVTLLENFEKRGLAVKEGAGRQPRPDLKSGTKVLS